MLNTQSVSLLVNRDPEIMGGTPVFRGTRVPIKTMFDHLEGGHSLDEFLEELPSVSREQIIALLELYKDLLLAAV